MPQLNFMYMYTHLKHTNLQIVLITWQQECQTWLSSAAF